MARPLHAHPNPNPNPNPDPDPYPDPNRNPNATLTLTLTRALSLTRSGLPETGTVVKSKLPTNEQWLETYERLGLKRLVAQGRQQAEREARLTLSLTL